MAAMIDLFYANYWQAPAAIVLDIDDTFGAVHGRQQLSLFKPITTNAVSCRSTFMIGTAASRWR